MAEDNNPFSAGAGINPVPQPSKPNEEPQQQEDLDFFDYAADAGLGVVRGALGFGQSIYDLTDFITADILPDVDLKQATGIGNSKTFVGGLTEGVTQFALGFLPAGAAIRGASMAGKLGKFGKLVTKKNALGRTQLNVKGDVVAGVTSDFLSFGGQEERLSNLLTQYPELQNPVTEYLAYNEGDGEIEGRIKNVIEGLFLEVGVGIPVAHMFMKSLDTLKKGAKEVPADSVEKTVKETQDQVAKEVAENEKIALELADTLEPREATATVKDPEVKPETGKAEKLDETDPEVPTEEKTPIGVDPNKLKEHAENLAKGETIGTGGRVPTVIAESAGEVRQQLDITAKGLQEKAARDPKITWEEQVEQAKRLNEHFDGEEGSEYYEDLLSRGLEGATDVIKNTMVYRNAATLHLQSISIDLKDSLEQIHKLNDIESDDFTRLHGKVNSLLKSYNHFSALRSRYGSQVGRALNGQKMGVGVKDNAKVNVNPDGDLAELAKMNADANVTLDPDEVREFVKMFKDNEEHFTLFPDALNNVFKGVSQKHKTGEVLNTIWRNSILSGVSTVSTAVSSGFLNSFIQLTRLGVGGALGDTKVAQGLLQMGFRHLSNFNVISAYKDTLRTGVSAFEGSVFKSSVGEMANANSFRAGDGITKWVFENVVRFPEKNLSAIDAIMKHYNFRVAAQTRLAAQGSAKGLEGKQLHYFVQKNLRSVMLENGAINNPVGVRREIINKWKENGQWETLSVAEKAEYLAKAEQTAADRLKGFDAFDGMVSGTEFQKGALDYADEVMFTKELEGWQKQMAGGIKQMPLTEWVVPFIRTPLNVINRPVGIVAAPIKAAIGATAGGINRVSPYKFDNLERIRTKFLSELASDDPYVKAMAKGKLAMGMGAQFTIYSLINSNHTNITGGGPADPAARKRLEDTGWQPYSVKIGDKYFSYKKLDPIASIFGAAADARDISNDPATMGNGFAETAFTATFTAVSNNIYDKSFLMGLNMFIDGFQDERKFKKVLQNYATSVVPTIVPQAQELISGSPESAEIWSLGDAYRKRLGFATGSLDPKRNILGEEIDTQEVSGLRDRLFDVVANVSEEKDDIVLEEIAMLRRGFDIPSKIIAGGINLTEFEDSNGRTAFDFYRKSHGTVKIGGKTLRQELTRVIKSRWYQKLDARSAPNFESQRIGELQKVIRRYRAEALSETLKEFKDLNTIYTHAAGLRSQAKKGYDVYNQVEELLQLY